MRLLIVWLINALALLALPYLFATIRGGILGRGLLASGVRRDRL